MDEKLYIYKKKNIITSGRTSDDLKIKYINIKKKFNVYILKSMLRKVFVFILIYLYIH